MGRTRDVSKILTSNTSILTLASASTTYATKTSTGLTLIIPSTISNTGGSASIATNGTVSFTSASAISLNDVFSATYQNYVISVSFSGTAGAYLGLRLRVGGADASGSNYTWGFVAVGTGGSSFVLTGAGVTSANISRFQNNAASISSAIFTVFRPFDADRTAYHGTSFYDDGATVAPAAAIGGQHGLQTSYTGFTLIPASGNVTGTISVYGYNK